MGIVYLIARQARTVAFISGSWFGRFPSKRNYRWGDSSSIFGPNMASEAISEVLILKIFLEQQHAPSPPSLFTLKRMQWRYQFKIAGSGPEHQPPKALLINWNSRCDTGNVRLIIANNFVTRSNSTTVSRPSIPTIGDKPHQLTFFHFFSGWTWRYLCYFIIVSSCSDLTVGRYTTRVCYFYLQWFQRKKTYLHIAQQNVLTAT